MAAWQNPEEAASVLLGHHRQIPETHRAAVCSDTTEGLAEGVALNLNTQYS